MERTPTGGVELLETVEAEDRVDRLALELLAPKATMLARLTDVNWRSAMTANKVQEILEQEFVLPTAVAESYGRMLVMQQQRPTSFRQWIGAGG
jgi:hypothetical protein